MSVIENDQPQYLEWMQHVRTGKMENGWRSRMKDSSPKTYRSPLFLETNNARIGPVEFRLAFRRCRFPTSRPLINIIRRFQPFRGPCPLETFLGPSARCFAADSDTRFLGCDLFSVNSGATRFRPALLNRIAVALYDRNATRLVSREKNIPKISESLPSESS